MNKYYKILELDKIVEMLKEHLFLSVSKKKFDEIELINDIEELDYSLNEVDEATILVERMGRIFIHFSHGCDVSYLLSKVHKNGALESSELAEIMNFLDTIKDCLLYIERLDNAKIGYQYIQNHMNRMSYPKELNLKIRKIITNYGEIKDDASVELRHLRKRVKDIETNIQSKLQEILQKNHDKLSQTIISIRNDRYVIPVKNDYKNQIKGIIHDQSASGETVFIEPMIICQLNNELNQCIEAEKQEIIHILKMVSIEIDNYYDCLLTSFNEIVDLDIIFGKAKLAIQMQASLPKINNKGIMNLLKCHHPLLNVEKIISNDIIIGKDYRGIIITGPNTGGKTVLLKTAGLLSLMTKMGLLIPCDENSEMAIYDNVFADIGDEQSIDQNLSTFSSHMKNVIYIIENITNNSLVLLDELGSGTDPVEGSSLAIAIFDFLIAKECNIIATSHYSELKMHAYSNSKMINASVEFNVETLKPTYRLLMGVPGMSNALKIAATLGLNQNIIDTAESYVYKKNDNLNLMLDKLVKQSNELDNRLQMVSTQKDLLADNNKALQLEITKTLQERNKIIDSANNEKNHIIDKAKIELDELFDELRSLKNKNFQPHEISDIKYRIKNLENENLANVNQENNAKITNGMSVYLKAYGSYGNVIKTLKNDFYEIQVGIASIKVHKDELSISSNENTITSKISSQNTILSVKKQTSAQLDLRGVRYEEAVDRIDKFLDDATYGGLKLVNIIHGFGTGTIRKLVQEKLSKNENITSFRYGGNGEGGQGVTIAILK